MAVGERQQREETRPLDRHAQLALVARARAGDARRHDLAVVVDEVAQDLDVLVVDLLDLLGREATDLLALEQRGLLDDTIVLNFAPAPSAEPLHLAFLIGEEHFDRVRARFDADGTPYTADPPGRRPGEVGEVNPDGSGRRLYFRGPDGHLLEVLTARYTDLPAGSAAG